MPMPAPEILTSALAEFIKQYKKKTHLTDEQLVKELVLDPLPVLLHGAFSGLDTEAKLLERERWRQLDKALTNQIGRFHEQILASIQGWHKPAHGFDLRHDGQKIIVEVKNKYNTMNAASTGKTYTSCEEFVKANPGWTVYLARIILKKPGRIDKPWEVSGRKPNDRIRLIDGATLYDMVTGEKNALRKVYQQLPGLLTQSGFPVSPEVEAWFTRPYRNIDP